MTEWDYTNSTLRAEEVDGTFKWLTADNTWSFDERDAAKFPDYDGAIATFRKVFKRKPLMREIERLQFFNYKGEPLYGWKSQLRNNRNQAARRKLQREAFRKVKEILSDEEMKALGLFQFK